MSLHQKRICQSKWHLLKKTEQTQFHANTSQKHPLGFICGLGFQTTLKPDAHP